jgi:hypothetical protein
LHSAGVEYATVMRGAVSVSRPWRTTTLPVKIARSARSWTSIRSAATSTGASESCPFSADDWPNAAAGPRTASRRRGRKRFILFI